MTAPAFVVAALDWLGGLKSEDEKRKEERKKKAAMRDSGTS